MSSTDAIDATLEAADAPAPDAHGKPQHPARLDGASWKYALRRAIREFVADGGTDLAAMLTYYTVLSIAPAGLAIFSIISLVLANNASTVTGALDDVVAQLPETARPLVADLVENLIGQSTGGIIALVIGIATAVWSASAYVKAFSRCMNTVYGVVEGRGIVKQTATMLLVTIALLVGIVVVLISVALNETLVTNVLGPIAEPAGLGGVLAFLTQTFLPIWAWLKWPVILAIVIALVAVLYYLAPNLQQPKFTWVSIGSVVAIVGIALAAVALSLYFAFFAGYSSYGAIGAVMALLFALWIFNIVLILGAEVDAEVERARQLQAGIPAEDTIQLPPRDTKLVEKKAAQRDAIVESGRELRHAHGGDDESQADARGDEGGATRREPVTREQAIAELDRIEREREGKTPDGSSATRTHRRAHQRILARFRRR